MVTTVITVTTNHHKHVVTIGEATTMITATETITRTVVTMVTSVTPIHATTTTTEATEATNTSVRIADVRSAKVIIRLMLRVTMIHRDHVRKVSDVRGVTSS